MVTIIPQNPKPWLPSFPTSSSRTNSSLPFASKIIGPKIVNTSNNDNETKQSSAGKIKREVLTKEGRTKLNTFSDREFYAYPRFVTHVDDGFISTLTNLYRQRLRPGSKILDLMSSWVSHLPEEVAYKRVVGHGLNAQELAKNPRLDYFIVKDLNQDQKLEFEDGSFDAALCTVSVQYLQRPEKDLAGRLLTVNKAAPRGSQPGRPRSYRIYFGNLPWQVDDTHLVQVFSEHGKVVNARIVYDRETGRSCGFGFVIMSNEMEPNDAIAALDGQSLDGRAIRVNVAEERLRRDSFSVLGDDSAKHDVYLLYLVYSLGKGDPNISFLLEWTL